jgi:DNA-binding transcriptional LysR family regulator
MDRLTTMTTFLRVVQCSNFTAAAEELSISRTLVSRHVADLEAHLGIKLLNRTTRQVTPTEAGLRYADLCQKVLSDIRSSEEQISAIKNELDGEISVLCPIWIGSFGISPATAEFCKRNPGVTIRLQFEEPSANPHEFLTRGHDLCIQPNVLRDSSIMVKKIGKIEHLLVASAEYLEARGTPVTVADLAHHDCLSHTTVGSWAFANGERMNLRSPARYASNSVFSLREACMAGLGIAMLPQGIMHMPLVQEQLVTVLPDNPPAVRPLYVAFPPGDAPRRTKALITFLAEWFRQHSPDEA